MRPPKQSDVLGPEPEFGTKAWKHWANWRKKKGLPVRTSQQLAERDSNWKELQEREAKAALARRKAKGLV